MSDGSAIYEDGPDDKQSVITQAARDAALRHNSECEMHWSKLLPSSKIIQSAIDSEVGRATCDLLRANEELQKENERLMEYAKATEYWKLDPHDSKERRAHLDKIAREALKV